MRRSNFIIFFIFIFILTTLFCYAEKTTVPIKDKKEKEFVIIANKSMEFDSISYGDLKELYLGRNRKIKGVYIFPAMYPDCECFNTFLKKVLGLSRRDFDIRWKKAIFTGRGKPPKILRSISELVSYVSLNRNSIGVVSKDDVTDKVKVLNIREHITDNNTLIPKQVKEQRLSNN